MAEVSKLFSPILCPPYGVDESSTENYAQTLAAAYPKYPQKEYIQEKQDILQDTERCVDGHAASAHTLLNASLQKRLENVHLFTPTDSFADVSSVRRTCV
jgi:hypothetical protein